MFAHFPSRLGQCQLQSLCVYGLQLAKFPHVHLVAGGWYLDCSRGFVPDVEESLYNNLVTSAPEVVELKEELKEDNSAPQSIEKDVAPVKGKAKGRKVVPHASSQVSTRSYTKASVQHIVAPATTVVGSPPPLLLPLPPILLLLVSIAMLPSCLCLARGRLLHRILLRLRRRGHVVFH